MLLARLEVDLLVRLLPPLLVRERDLAPLLLLRGVRGRVRVRVRVRVRLRVRVRVGVRVRVSGLLVRGVGRGGALLHVEGLVGLVDTCAIVSRGRAQSIG